MARKVVTSRSTDFFGKGFSVLPCRGLGSSFVIFLEAAKHFKSSRPTGGSIFNENGMIFGSGKGYAILPLNSGDLNSGLGKI